MVFDQLKIQALIMFFSALHRTLTWFCQVARCLPIKYIVHTDTFHLSYRVLQG